ncbi:uncharacterized protein GGS25DRAFT_483346 [Hypoxylon fragiforme]|uniref:uncharacterized protein n=1 Tax=Hypoxylon fragiforme TaxID=63214 RepID=UPI0020C60085|nr:uncharacterized protein GGS25DRAFT_483346 [Hypoxylon fragiforme]KAI2611599.1 hypothetical protein GGS25DRAFT_483346 [Hypoxylon fragiforme]
MASYMGLEKNISYWTIPAAFVLALLPRVYAGHIGLGKKFFDGTNPRTFTERLEKANIDKRSKLRLQRAEAAGANAFETLGLYAAAVTAGNAADLPRETLNTLSLAYLATRVLYTWVYIWGQENRRFAPVRTLVWSAGIFLVMRLFILSAS